MAFIADKDQETIRQHFAAHLAGDVEIVLFTERESPIIVPSIQPCETCKDTEALLAEVAALSDRLKLTVHELREARDEAASYGVERVPVFVLKGAARGQVRFFGIPSGYEFSALIADIVDASNGTTELSEATRSFLGGLDQEINIKVFTTPT
ncbi:MAG TPA: thioredoxin family protein [Blastocatellia bacterium]|nr:thioredoxin family protein [Blastocatellia bacterium]